MTEPTPTSTLFPTYPTYPSVYPRQECPDLSPCTCYASANYPSVDCDEVAMEEVKIAFSMISPPIVIDRLSLFIRPQLGDSIPADLLGQSQVAGALEIYGDSGPYFNSSQPLLTVDPNSFRSSSDTLQSISFIRFDGRLLDFGFLAGFRNLQEFKIGEVTELYRSLPTLPALPALSSLSFYYEPSLNTALASGDLVLQCDGLTFLFINDCGMDEFGMAQLLDWILPSSAKTLREITTINTVMKSMPLQMASFQALLYIRFESNDGGLAIPSNSLYINGKDESSAYPYIRLSDVNFVASGAFQGR